MSNWYRELKNLMESNRLDEMDAPYVVTNYSNPDFKKMRFDDVDDAKAYAHENKGIVWFRDEMIADYSGDDEVEEGTLDEVPMGEPEPPADENLAEREEDDPYADKEPCIPRIAYYTDEDEKGRPRRHYEAILFFPAADANYGKIVCYAHVGQHSEAAMDFFARHTYNVTPANLVRAGLTQEDFDDLIKEWENQGPDNGKVKLYRRDQDSFRKARWHHI